MPSVILYAGLVTLSCLFLLVRRATRSANTPPLPPGPPALPIIGNVHQAPKSYRWRQYHDWGKQYGPIVYLNMMGQPLIILNTSKAAHDLLAKRGSTMSDRPRLVVAAELAHRGMNTLLMQYDDRFRLHQRLENVVLNGRAAAMYAPFQELESRQLLLDLLRNAGGTGTECHRYFERTTASTILTLFYGFRIRSVDDDTLQAASALNEEFSKSVQPGAHLIDIFPFLKILPKMLSPWKLRADPFFARLSNLHVGNFQRGLVSSGWNFAKHLHQTVQDEGISMPTQELAIEFGTMLDAALDGTIESLMWFVVACITQKDFVTKAWADLDNVVGRDRLPTLRDRPQLLYISAIVEEVLRWQPAGAAGVPHFTKTESRYEGYMIPARSIIIANHWGITREEAVFGPNIDSFVPERWLDEESIAKNELRDLPVVGFGYGRRLCPGRHFARNVLWIGIAQLLWAFDMKPGISQETGEPVTIDPFDVTDGLVMRPMPFKVAFEPRGPWVKDLLLERGDTYDEDFASILGKIGEGMSRQ
ncbi:putative cytochrome P450 [Xylariomycetidae sp. FL2044]|nr:putative cytochrome P450 [Xylariomycetidae sp. FL2044]